MRYLTAGESHGPCLTAIVEGVPAGLKISESQINTDLSRRQSGYGRGGRQRIERDTVEVVSGVRFGRTLGTPIALVVRNRDWENWTDRMATFGEAPSDLAREVTPRPGHADLVGALKTDTSDCRNILERASARETAARVAAAGIAREFLADLGVEVFSYVTSIGSASFKEDDALMNAPDYKPLAIETSEVRCPDEQATEAMKAEIDRAKDAGESLGGKTGVNLAAGKNLVGAFKQPAYVCADTATLATLDEREWACGCAEIAKSAVIDSDDFFFWLVDAAGALAARDEVVVEEAIARSVVFKADVVAADKSESKGVRECLNYGHTLGHAVESLAGYGAFSHGAAVAEGMRFAARMAVSLVDAPLDLVETQDSLLDQLGLPALDWSAEPEAMLEAMKRDKKARRGQVRFVLPRDVGSWQLADVDDATILDHLNAWARSKA